MCIILIHIFSPGSGIDLRSRGAKLEIAKRQNYIINITSIHAHTDVLNCHSLADNSLYSAYTNREVPNYSNTSNEPPYPFMYINSSSYGITYNDNTCTDMMYNSSI